MNADQVKELLSNATPGEWRTSRKDMDSFAQGEDGKVGHVVYVYRGTAQHRVPVFAGPLDNARDDAALIAAAPAVAQWGLERDAEVARLREALNRIACAWTITANSLYVNGGTEFHAGKAAGLAQASESLTRTIAAALEGTS